MSNTDSDSFIREVTEEVRQDQMFALWKKWGVFIIGGVAAIVGGAAYWSWSEAQTRAAAEARGALFVAADAEETDRQIALTDQVDGPAALLAELTAAGALSRAGETADAGKRFAEIAARADVPADYRDLALLQAVRLGAATDAAADLDRLITGGSAFRLLALEERAALRLAEGQTDAAHEDLRLILVDPTATNTLRQRAEALLSATGGTADQPEG